MRTKALTYGKTRKRRRAIINLKFCLAAIIIAIFSLQIAFVLRHNRSEGGGATNNTPDEGQSLRIQMKYRVKLGTHTKKLPIWIQNYIAWHKSMTAKYPGEELFKNPDAPNLLIRVCLGLCGGLHDRLGQLPWDLYLANRTGRVLLMKWDRPKALENFLLPNEFNWSLPIQQGFRDMHEVRAHKELFDSFVDDHPEKEFWETSLDFSLERATTGEFKDEKVLRHRLLGHLDEAVLEQRLKDLGETDMLHWTPSYGNIFKAFFKPSDGVQRQLDAVHQELKIVPGSYTAVHCRVRHPKATPSNVYIKGKSASHPADKTGLPWYGQTKDFAVWIASKAIYCARSLSKDKQEPIYFFADSNDLVRYMVHELKDPHFVKANATIFDDNNFDKQALEAVTPVNIIAREMSEENAHIDRQKGRPPEAYFATFVDLYLAINARCVTYGIGYYALFATKISGIQCKLGYMEEQWGGREGSKRAPSCDANLYKHLEEPLVEGDELVEGKKKKKKRKKHLQES